MAILYKLNNLRITTLISIFFFTSYLIFSLSTLQAAGLPESPTGSPHQGFHNSVQRVESRFEGPQERRSFAFAAGQEPAHQQAQVQPAQANCEQFIRLSYIAAQTKSGSGSEHTSGHCLVLPDLQQSALTHEQQKEQDKANKEILLFLKDLENFAKIRFIRFSAQNFGRNHRLDYFVRAIKIYPLLDRFLGFDPFLGSVPQEQYEQLSFYCRFYSDPYPKSSLKPDLLESIVDHIQKRCKKADALYKAFHNLLTSNIPEKTYEIWQMLREKATLPGDNFSDISLQKYFDPSYDNNRCELNVLACLDLIKKLVSLDFREVSITQRIMYILTVVFTNGSEREDKCYVEQREIPNPLASTLTASSKKILSDLLASLVLDFIAKSHDIALLKIISRPVSTGATWMLGQCKVIAFSIKSFEIFDNTTNEGQHLKGDRDEVFVFQREPDGRLEFAGYLPWLRKDPSRHPILKEISVNIEAFSIQNPRDQAFQNGGIFDKLCVFNINPNSKYRPFDRAVRRGFRELLGILGKLYDRSSPENPETCSNSPNLGGKFNVEMLSPDNKSPITANPLGLLHFHLEMLENVERVRKFGTPTSPMVLSPVSIGYPTDQTGWKSFAGGAKLTIKPLKYSISKKQF